MAANPPIVATLIALSVLALGGCATPLAPDDAVASGRFQIDARGRFIVKLAVNGHAPRPFIVDTAASISAVYAPFAESLGLAPMNGSVTVHGLMASGELPLVLASQLAFDRAQWTNRSVVKLPAQPTDAALREPPVGILGHDILEGYGIEFSIASRTVRFYSPLTMAQRRYQGWTSVPLSRGRQGTPSASIYFLELHIESEPARAVFDLGSGVNIVNWRAARRGGVTKRDFSRAKTCISRRHT